MKYDISLMENNSEDKPKSMPIFGGSKSLIFDRIQKLRSWQEDQFKQFQTKQLIELKQGQKSLQHLFPEVKENSQDINSQSEENFQNHEISPEKSQTDKSTSSENSIVNHLLNCFSDSHNSSLTSPQHKSLLRSENATSNQTKKFPFLKKGTGLLRYQSGSKKQNATTWNIHKKTINSSATKSIIHPFKMVPENKKSLHFDVPINKEPFDDKHVNSIDKLPKGNSSQSITQKNKDLVKDNDPTNDATEGLSTSFEEKIHTEQKELVEFEILENYAQNNSFNSDSSFVQKVLHGETIQPNTNRITVNANNNMILPKNQIDCNSEPKQPNTNPTTTNTIDNNETLNKQTIKESQEHHRNQDYRPTQLCEKFEENNISNSTFNQNLRNKNSNETNLHEESNKIYTSLSNNFSKRLEEIHQRKQNLKQMILEVEPQLAHLEQEIISGISKTDPLPVGTSGNDSLNCSTPIKNHNEMLEPILNLPNIDGSSSNSSFSSIPDILNQENHTVPLNEKINEEEFCGITAREKQIFKEKIKELEKEIELYQKQNSLLSNIQKERELMLKKLQKEQRDFQQVKEQEKKKLADEIEEERRQIKRQKETFLRYQRLRQDNPTRKERVELIALRQQVEKLQEELKRQNIKSVNDNKRYKNRLAAIEKERDSLRMENLRLEDQCQDLISTLKSLNKKLIKNSKIEDSSKSKNFASKETKNKTKQITDVLNDKSRKSSECHPNQTVSRHKVRFNLIPEFQDYNSSSDDEKETTQNDDSDISKNDEYETPLNNRNEIYKNNENENLANIENPKNIERNLNSKNDEILKEQENNDIERILDSGEKEIIFTNGTRKIISSDGLNVKIYFYNGDIKEIISGTEIYKYANGIIETRFPDGLQVIEFTNGKLQRCYPDGMREMKDNDGTVHFIHTDGSEEIHYNDGTIITLGSDKTETIYFPDGQKEIRTTTYKRREFSNGAVKIIYNNGRQETRYPDGRIRIKNDEGKVIFDTKYITESIG